MVSMAPMDAERWSEVERLFNAALMCPAAEREDFLAVQCGSDDRLRAEVAALLRADDDDVTVLAQLHAGAEAGHGSERPIGCRDGERLGPYRIVEKIGEGGMSHVFLAERDDAHFEKRVAIKVLKQGLGGGSVLARFRNECRILASLEHPSIARLYDAGKTSAGAPYVVMELVGGVPIDRYCSANGLGVAARLRLFRQVCAAVSYAHQQLVVHRDLKPSNILVTGDGMPKLLDFGIAKLNPPHDPPAMGTTAPWLRPMTPQYASPEQLRGERVTTASDVYSLGVLLYELLTGQLPYRLTGRSLLELERFLRAVDDPPQPSVVVSTARAGEGKGDTTPRRGRRGVVSPAQLRGDLDSIVLQALRREPQQRYASAADFAADLDRHLTGRPVRARGRAFPYRAAKFLRRYRLSLLAATALVGMLAAYAVSAVFHARSIARERDRAEQVTSFLVDLFEVYNSEETGASSDTVRQILDQGTKRIDAELSTTPDLHATALDTLGVLYTKIGAFEEARRHIEAGLALRRQYFGPTHVDVATSLHNLSAVMTDSGNLERSLPLLLEALALRRQLLGNEHPQVAVTLRDMGIFEMVRGDYAAAEEHLRASIRVWCAVSGERGNRQQAKTLGDLGSLLVHAGRFDEGESLLEDALAMRRALFGDEHPDLAESYADLGILRHERGDYASAETLLREALRLRYHFRGDSHPQVASALSQLARCLEAQGKLDEAETHFRESLAITRSVHGDEHTTTATVLNNLAAVLRRRGDHGAASAVYRQVLDIRLRAFGEDHVHVAQARHSLAQELHDLGELGEAEALFRLALAGTDQALPPDHHLRSLPRVGLGRVLIDLGRAAEAEPFLEVAVTLARGGLPADHWRVADAESALGACRAARGHFEAAQPLLQRSYELLQGAQGDDHRTTRWARTWLAELLRATGHPEQAAALRGEEGEADS